MRDLSDECVVQVRHVLDAHTAPVPAVLEIPSKDSPYDPNKDSILRSGAEDHAGDDLYTLLSGGPKASSPLMT